MRYAVTFTNLDVLASVAGRRVAARYVAAGAVPARARGCSASRSRVRTARRSSPSDKATVILVVDVSGSMHATDVKPTRLGAAQAAVRTFLERVPKRVEVGLIAFSSEPQVAAPPTTDRDLVRASLDELDFLQAYGGTAIGDALAAAVELGQEDGAAKPKSRQTIAYTVAKKNPLVSILFLSDGKQTRGALQPLEGAQRAKAAGIPVYTVALGTPNGVLTRPFGGSAATACAGADPVPPDPTTLRAIAKHDRRQVLQRALRGRAAVRLQGARLEARPRPGNEEVTNEAVFLAALLLIAAAILSALWAPRLP